MDQVKKVDTKPTQSIAQMASEGGSFSTLAAGLKAAGLVDTLAGKGPFTVFAPSDEAFKKLPQGALEVLMKDKEKLKAVLNYHVVNGHLSAKELKSGDLNTMEGTSVHVQVFGASVEINGAHILGADIVAMNSVIHAIDAVLLPEEGISVHVKASGVPVEINGAHIMSADIVATNGVIHAIDAVLLPKNVKLLAKAA